MNDNIEKKTKYEPLEIFFYGSSGRIHGKYYKSTETQNYPVILMLHPDPSLGGSMNNKIISDATRIFHEAGFAVLKINYRGVGKSEGVFNDEDQINDASVALDWLQTNNPNVSHFWIFGYSLGAWIGANLMMRRPEIECFVLVSPLVNKYDFSFLSPCPASGLIIQGNEDQFIEISEVKQLIEFMNNQNNNVVDYCEIDKADHVFTNYKEQLYSALRDYINTKLSTRVNKPIRKKRRRRRRKDSII